MPIRAAAVLDWRLLVASGWGAYTHQQLLKSLHALAVLTNKFSLNRTCSATRSLKQQLEMAAIGAEGNVLSEVTIREVDSMQLLTFGVQVPILYKATLFNGQTSHWVTILMNQS